MITDLAQAIMTRFNETPAGDALRAVLTGGLWFTQAKPDQAFPYAVFRWDGSNIDEICGGQNQRLETATITVEVFSNNDDGGTEVFDAVEKFMDHFDWCELTYPSDILGDEELVTNGGFDGNANGWTPTGSFRYSIPNELVYVGPSAVGTLYQSISITAGITYRLTATVQIGGGASGGVKVGEGDTTVVSNGENSFDIVAGSGDTTIELAGIAPGGADLITFDNISVKELDHRYSHIAFKRNSIVNRGKIDNIWMIEIEYEAMFSH